MRAVRERRAVLPGVIALFVTIVVSLFLHAAPTRLPAGVELLPTLPMITLYIWSIRRPLFVSPALLFLVGLLQDLLTGGPMGVWALAYLVAFSLARPRDADGAGAEVGPASLRFGALALIAYGFAWGAGSFAMGGLVNPGALIAEGVLTILLFPAFAWAFARRRERSTFSS